MHLQKYDTGLTHLAEYERNMYSSGADGVVRTFELMNWFILYFE